jgi:hypothetical protein
MTFNLHKHFEIDTNRDLLVPDFCCYQMNLKRLTDKVIEDGLIDDEQFKLLPSWSKFAANPARSKFFFISVLQALFLGTGGFGELNVDDITENWSGDNRVAMMFVSAHNEQMKMINKFANEALGAYKVVTLSGGVPYNGVKVTQKNCEQIVREVVEQATKENKSVLIISNIMGQRSFSIPQITELYLAYDKGEMGATLQRMSRALTPGEINKTGRIFSLSFDPNRDDKFDAMIIETALNIKARKGHKSLAESLRTVLSTIDIINCTPEGAFALDKDSYLEAAMQRKAVSRVIGKTVNLPTDKKLLTAIAQGDTSYIRSVKQEAAEYGKTRDAVAKEKQSNTANSVDKADANLQARAREVIVGILENLDILIMGTDCKVLVDAMEIVKSSQPYRDAVAQEFGLDFEIIEYLFEAGIITQEHAELMFDT